MAWDQLLHPFNNSESSIIGYLPKSAKRVQIFHSLIPVGFVMNEGGYGSIVKARCTSSPEASEQDYAVKLIPCTRKNGCPSSERAATVGKTLLQSILMKAEKLVFKKYVLNLVRGLL